MMEVIPHSQPATSSSESFWHGACGILLLFLALANASAASPPALNVVISQEAAPPGATVQIKLSLAKPAAVSSGELALDFDPTVFGPVTAIATFSATGDGSGFAFISGSHVDIHFQSVSATLGSAAGMPLVVITVPTLATAKPGTQATINADPSGSQWGGPGPIYSVTVTPGSVTIGGSLSVSDVSPVSNLAAGAVVRIRGGGFTSATTVDIAAVSVASVQQAEPQEINVTLVGPADLGGKQITVRNPGGSQVAFFAASSIPMPFATLGTGDGLDGAIPLFPAASYDAGLSNVLVQGFTQGRVALANPNGAPVDVLLQAVDQANAVLRQTTITIPPGGTYNSDLASLEASGNAPFQNQAVRVLATAPLHMLQIVGEQNPPSRPTASYQASPFMPTQPVLGSVLNAASNSQGAIAPGEIIAIRGMEFSYLGQATTYMLDSFGRVPTYLNGTEVLINGKPAPLLYTSPSQVNAIVPYEVAGQRTATVQAIFNRSSQISSVPVAPAAPGIFTLDATGAGPAAVLNQDNSVNGPSQPAARGSVIQIFATGIPVRGAVTGSITPAPSPGSTDPVSVGIGGVTASIRYAGPAPGEIAGLIQVNAVVPDNAPTGPAIPIVLSVSPPQGPLQPIIYASQAGATIAVQ